MLTQRYSVGILIFFSFLILALFFSGRGFSLDVGNIDISYGFLLSLIPIFVFYDKINLNSFKRNGLYLSIAITNFLFVYYSLFTLFYTKSPYYGLSKTLNLFLFIVSCYLVLSLLRKIEFIKIIKYCIYLITALAVIYISINIASGFQSRVGLLGAGSITTGRLFAFACIFSIYFIVILKEKRFIYICLLLTIAVFLSGSRGNFLFLLISLVAPWALNNIKILIKMFLGLSFLFFIVYFFSLHEKIPFFYRYTLLLEGGGESILIRFDAYRLAFELFKDNFMLGIGSGSYSYYTLGYDSIDYPHNVLIEIAAELGFVGLFLFFIIISLSFIAVRKNIVVLPLFVFYFLISMGSGDLFDARLIFVIPLIGFILRKD